MKTPGLPTPVLIPLANGKAKRADYGYSLHTIDFCAIKNCDGGVESRHAVGFDLARRYLVTEPE